jgi:hypothetical protein
VVSAKFGGEFKIMRTSKKSKSSNLESFAEKCTRDSMKMFSRSQALNGNLFVVTAKGDHKLNFTRNVSETETRNGERYKR